MGEGKARKVILAWRAVGITLAVRVAGFDRGKLTLEIVYTFTSRLAHSAGRRAA